MESGYCLGSLVPYFKAKWSPCFFPGHFEGPSRIRNLRNLASRTLRAHVILGNRLIDLCFAGLSLFLSRTLFLRQPKCRFMEITLTTPIKGYLHESNISMGRDLLFWFLSLFLEQTWMCWAFHHVQKLLLQWLRQCKVHYHEWCCSRGSDNFKGTFSFFTIGFQHSGQIPLQCSLIDWCSDDLFSSNPRKTICRHIGGTKHTPKVGWNDSEHAEPFQTLIVS